VASPAVILNAIQAARAADLGAGNYLSNWERSAPALSVKRAADWINSAGGNPNALVDAVLLGYGVFGRANGDAGPLRQAIVNWSALSLATELKHWMAFSVQVDRGSIPGGKPILAPSFRYATTGDVMSVNRCFESASLMVQKAFLAAKKALNGPGAERTLMQQWFGAHDATRFGRVVHNLKTLNDQLFLKQVIVYYRGLRVSGPTDDAADAQLLAQPRDAFAAAWNANSRSIKSYNRNFAHIEVGRKFFSFTGKNAGQDFGVLQGVSPGIANRIQALTGGTATAVTRLPAAPRASVSGTDSLGGVLIHELSHHLCGTADEVMPGTVNTKAYGQNKCTTLAAQAPNKAINNADNYEYFCEAFQ
jgi:hypothetical protein